MSKSSKGSRFEREFCRQLSLWWTQDLPEPRDDVFWRTSGSGARAKVRGRKNRQTAGQHGDICATDPVGKPLIDAITWELKRGYSKHTIADLIDKPDGAAKQIYEKWIEQAEESQQQAGSATWAIVVQRDRREALLIAPPRLASMLPLDSMRRLTIRLEDRGTYHAVLMREFFKKMQSSLIVAEFET